MRPFTIHHVLADRLEGALRGVCQGAVTHTVTLLDQYRVIPKSVVGSFGGSERRDGVQCIPVRNEIRAHEERYGLTR
jgi:hypothetical protein